MTTRDFYYQRALELRDFFRVVYGPQWIRSLHLHCPDIGRGFLTNEFLLALREGNIRQATLAHLDAAERHAIALGFHELNGDSDSELSSETDRATSVTAMACPTCGHLLRVHLRFGRLGPQAHAHGVLSGTPRLAHPAELPKKVIDKLGQMLEVSSDLDSDAGTGPTAMRENHASSA